MPEQQPDKRCGTCDRWYASRPGSGRCLDDDTVRRSSDGCPWWTPKPPKNPEEK